MVCDLAQGSVSIEASLGTAYNVPGRLDITEPGYEDLSPVARFETHPFEPPFYWQVRVGLPSEASGWELQLVHHKLYLSNPPPTLEHFEITHGFNLLTLNRRWALDRWRLRTGVGVVVAHPDVTLRGERRDYQTGGLFGAGYRLTGPAVIAGAGRPIPLTRRLWLAPEMQFSLAWARVSLGAAEARARSAAVHFQCGLGFAP